jgi:hypothetical protein
MKIKAAGVLVVLSVIMLAVFVGCEGGPQPTASPVDQDTAAMVTEDDGGPGVDVPAMPAIEDVLNAVAGFFVDARFHVIALMIFVDLGLGLSAAIRSGEFDWARVGDFYRSNVVPYVLSYLVLYIAFDVMPGLGDFVDQALKSISFAAIVASLGGSIKKNLDKLALQAG